MLVQPSPPLPSQVVSHMLQIGHDSWHKVGEDESAAHRSWKVVVVEHIVTFLAEHKHGIFCTRASVPAPNKLATPEPSKSTDLSTLSMWLNALAGALFCFSASGS